MSKKSEDTPVLNLDKEVLEATYQRGYWAGYEAAMSKVAEAVRLGQTNEQKGEK